MGTPGVAFNIPKSRILEVIKKKKGVVTQICKELKIAYDTYKKHIRDNPQLKQALDDARDDYADTICDLAETALMRALEQTEDLGSSLSSAKFVLNNQGRKRGYYPPVAPQENKELDVNGLIAGIKGLLEDAGSQGARESRVAAKQSLPDRRS